MSKLRVQRFSISLDGYGAGPNQSLDNPLGVNGMKLHEWFIKTKYFQQKQGNDDANPTPDDHPILSEYDENIGATIMGRNMFGPIRGDWNESDWQGWWGDTPPYGHSVFVLTHFPHDPIEMKGGTTFYFVNDKLENVLEQAKTAANGQDVLIGGGVSTVQQFLNASLIDYMHIAVVPEFLGNGERLFENINDWPDGYECTEFVSTPSVAHYRITRTN